MEFRAFSPLRPVLTTVVVAALVLLFACSSNGTNSNSVVTSEDAGASADDATSADDAGPATRSAACTPVSQQTGSAVSSAYGRLDGTLVYVAGIGQGRSCNGDNSHIHLQVGVSGSVYDVAVDVGTTSDEVGLFEQNLTVPGGVWQEGWHSADTLAYPASGIHASSFVLTAPDALGSQLTNLLENTSKVSIFCTGYSQRNGCHDVHYKNGSGNDGAIVLSPTAADSPVIFLRFSSQNF